MILAGKLDRQIDILQSPSTNDLGEVIGVWSVKYSVWASYKPQTGKQFQSAERPSTEAIDRFVIRYLPDINETHRVRYNSTVYEIVQVAETGRFEALELVCRRTS